MKIAFLLYPTDKVKVDEDTSFWIIVEMVRRGHQVSIFESRQLFARGGRLYSGLRPAIVDPALGYLPSSSLRKAVDLSRLDAIFIRKEPPFDAEYHHTMQLLSILKKRVFMLNHPEGISACNEKLFILQFPEFITKTFVSADIEELAAFISALRSEAVVKPLDQKGGSGIIKTSVRDRGLRRKLQVLTRHGSLPVMAQRFIPHRLAGDKRILVLNGDVLGCFLRRPAPNEFRANLGLGGSMHPAKITSRDRRLVRTMAPVLRKHGLYFVGLDVIDGYLSEVNVTSPSGIPEMKQLYGVDLEKQIVNFVEKGLRSFLRLRR